MIYCLSVEFFFRLEMLRMTSEKGPKCFRQMSRIRRRTGSAFLSRSFRRHFRKPRNFFRMRKFRPLLPRLLLQNLLQLFLLPAACNRLDEGLGMNDAAGVRVEDAEQHCDLFTVKIISLIQIRSIMIQYLKSQSLTHRLV